MKKYYVGIQGINIKNSVALASDVNGNVIARITGPPLDLHALPRHVLRVRIFNLLRRVADAVDCSLDSYKHADVCIGMTGMSSPYESGKDLPAEIARLELDIGNLICAEDTAVIFSSLSDSSVGSAIVCNTGVAAYYTDNSYSYRVGSRGASLNDYGSGYWMGLAAVRAISEEIELSSDKSILWNEIESWLGDDTHDVSAWRTAALLWQRRSPELANYDPRTALFPFIHEVMHSGIWRETASGFVIPLVNASQKGDSKSKEILDRAITQLAEYHFRVLRIAKKEEPPGPIVLSGGVICHNSIFTEKLKETLVKYHKSDLKFVLPDKDRPLASSSGALIYALGRSITKKLRWPKKDIVERVRETERKYIGGHGSE